MAPDRSKALMSSINEAEKKFIPEHKNWMFALIGRAAFNVEDAPRQAVHIPTTPEETAKLMDELNTLGVVPSPIRAADLGCGLGAFADSLSLYLSDHNISDFRITGFDFSPSILDHAKSIAKENGISNIEFVQKDFTELTKDDLKPYNLIYIFKPFKEIFNPLMEAYLPKIAPGTLIITRMCREVAVLKTDLFRFICYPMQKKYNDDFAAFIRTDSFI